jgi:hypothetical protein
MSSLPLSTTRSDLHADPASLGYPATLPVEIALRSQPVQAICESYGIDKAEWDVIRYQPGFIADVVSWASRLKEDGMAFKAKAQLQSHELLKESWRLIHAGADEVPPNVKADLIKFTIRAAGLDGSKDQAANQGSGVAFQINLNLG